MRKLVFDDSFIGRFQIDVLFEIPMFHQMGVHNEMAIPQFIKNFEAILLCCFYTI